MEELQVSEEAVISQSIESVDLSSRFECTLDGHCNDIQNALYSQWQQGDYCDLILQTNGGSIHVHTCFLAAFSPRIATAIKFNSHNKSSSDINTVDVCFKYNTVKTIIEAIYSGFFSAALESLMDLQAALQWLQMYELLNVVKDVQEKAEEDRLFQHLATPPSRYTNLVRLKNIVPTMSSKPLSFTLNENSCKSKTQTLDSKLTPQLLCDSPLLLSGESRSDLKQTAIVKLDKLSLKSDVVNLKTECAEVQRLLHNVNLISKYSKIKKRKNSKGSVGRPSKIGEKSKSSDARRLSKKYKTDRNSEPTKSPKGRKDERILKEKKNNKNKRMSTGGGSSSSSCEENLFTENKNTEAITTANIDENTSNTDRQQGQETEQNEEPSLSLVISGEHQLVKEEPGDDELFPPVTMIAQEPFKCWKCKMLFSNINELNNHLSDHPVFNCDKCGMVFHAHQYYTRHYRGMHLKPEHLKCSQCDYSAGFDDKNFAQHCLEVHQIASPFKCQFEGCKYATKKYRNLTNHFDVHESKMLRCEKCLKIFPRIVLLRSHMATCYGLRAHLCDSCGKGFNHRSELALHWRTIHLGERPYKCNVCSSCFSNHANLRRHKRIHDNSFPYSCPICKQLFRHSNTLKLHVSKHSVSDDHENIDLGAEMLTQNSKTTTTSSVITSQSPSSQQNVEESGVVPPVPSVSSVVHNASTPPSSSSSAMPSSTSLNVASSVTSDNSIINSMTLYKKPSPGKANSDSDEATLPKSPAMTTTTSTSTSIPTKATGVIPIPVFRS